MIDLVIVIALGVIAAVLALYSFLERGSWMYSQIVASFGSSFVLWMLTVLFATGNVGTETQYVNKTIEAYTYNGGLINKIETVYEYAMQTSVITEVWLVYILLFFALCMTGYFILHVIVWIQNRAAGIRDEEVED